MQLVTCSVALGGDLNNVRVFGPSAPVTVAEVVMLRTLHGHDAVTDIRPAKTVKRTNGQELERLRAKYDRNHQGEDLPPVQRVFPGARPVLPKTLEEILGEADMDEAEDEDEGVDGEDMVSTGLEPGVDEGEAPPPSRRKKAIEPLE